MWLGSQGNGHIHETCPQSRLLSLPLGGANWGPAPEGVASDTLMGKEPLTDPLSNEHQGRNYGNIIIS